MANLFDTLKPAIDNLRTSLTKDFSGATEELLALKDKIEPYEEAIVDKKEEVDAIESKTNKLELAYKKEKEVLAFTYEV
jgi:hypothetical protein